MFLKIQTYLLSKDAQACVEIKLRDEIVHFWPYEVYEIAQNQR